MSGTTVLDGVCRYFGGPYDPRTHTYRSSPVPGVGVVRRAWAKEDNHQDFFRGMPPGARTGSQIVFWIPRRSEGRFAVAGPDNGQKNVLYQIDGACYLRSRTPNAEDAQDDMYALQDALVEWARRDRTLGGACFQAGEHVEGGSGSIDFENGQSETKAQLTKSFFVMSFTALEIVQA